MPVTKVIENRIVTVDVNSIVENTTRAERLLPCDWDRAMFRFPHPMLNWRESRAIALNVEITGRTFQFRRASGTYWVKLRLEWVGDGEPSTFSEGWMLVDNPWTLPNIADVA